MPESTLRIITAVVGVFSLVMLFFSVRAMRRERPLSRVRPLVSAAIVVIVTLGYPLLSKASVNLWVALALAGLGLLFGWGEGRATKIYYKGSQVVGKQTGLYLIIWGLAYVITLLLAQTKIPALHASGILAMMLGMGVAVASSVTLLLRQGRLKPGQATISQVGQPVRVAQPVQGIAPPAYLPETARQNGQAFGMGPSTGAVTCTRCGNANAYGQKFCTQCGTSLAAVAAPQSQVRPPVPTTRPGMSQPSAAPKPTNLPE